jgi:formylglycine-generating enzyme required for sulfatase activity
MNITKHFPHSFCILHSAFCIAITSLMSAAFAADISDVIVRQQWPWSTDIKVEFKLTNMTGPVTVNVEAFDGDTPLDASNLKAAITGDLWGIAESGAHSFIIDPAAAFGAARNSIGDFKVRLSLTDAPANADEIIYKIVDLDPPYAVTDVRRRDFYNGKYGSFVTNFADIATGWTTSLDDVLIWTGVTEDDTYKTNKMVFRRIPAAGKSFQFQKGVAAATNAYYTAGQGIKVSFEKDFYIGVFEVTQAQFMKMAHSIAYNNFYFTNQLYSATRPADQVADRKDGLAVRKYWASVWPATRSHRSASEDYKQIMHSMQYKTGLLVDTPTEAMWEYACRAGTDTWKYSGQSGSLAYGDGFINNAAWSYNNSRSGYTGGNNAGKNSALSKGSHTVGALRPNAFGLYDMIGNVGEACLDWYAADYGIGSSDVTTTVFVEPEGPATGDGRVCRGYFCRYDYDGMFSASRSKCDTSKWYGARLMCPVGLLFPDNEKQTPVN